MKIEHRQTHTLRVHPAIRAIPELDHESPEFLAIASCHERDLGRPLNIDAQGRVLDDTSRSLLAAAKRWQREEVPVLVHDEEELHWLLIQDMAGRRHLSKSAVAYLLYPHFDAAASREKQLSGLKRGQNPNVSRCGLVRNRSGRDIAKGAGFDEKLLRMAGEVHEAFQKTRRYKFKIRGGPDDGAIVKLTLREYFEPRLLKSFTGQEYGDHDRPIGLGGILKGVGYARSGKCFTDEDRPSPVHVFSTAASKIQSGFRQWKALPKQERDHARGVWVKVLLALPDDLLAITDEMIEDRQKQRPDGDES